MIDPKGGFTNSGRERKMNTRSVGNTLHSMNLKKMLTLLLSALFVVSMISVFSLGAVQAASTPSPLHTSGHLILDANNNVVYLRGIGRTGDLQSASGMWSGPGDQVASWGQKWQPISANIADMDATLQSYQQYWKVNMIRVLIPVNWWWIDNVNANQFQSDAPAITISYRTYIETLVQEAAKYGIYVDFVPYSVLDVYSKNGWDGIPGSLGQESLNFMHSINADEMQAWRTWWTSVVNRLGQHSNVIFEMWNEPENEKQPYYNYMIEMYKTIRGLGNENLIFMQWNMGLVPTYHELDWIPEVQKQLTTSVGGTPINVAYTTHPYRYAPWPNTQWQTTYSSVQAQLNSPNIVPATRSNGIDVPLVFNEMGICQTAMDNQEMSFWDAILHNAKDMGIGVVAYYWMSDSDLGPVYSGESLVTGSWAQGAQSPTPNAVGQTFLNYAPAQTEQPVTVNPPPTTTTTPAPTPIVTQTPVQTPTQPAAPVTSTQPTQSATPISTPSTTPSPAPTPANTTKTNPTPTPQPTKATQPTQPSQPTQPIQRLPINRFYYFGQWHAFYWPRFNTWFIFHW